MKYLIAILLLVVPWLIFFAATRAQGGTNTIALLLTLAVSAYGFTMLISRGKK